MGIYGVTASISSTVIASLDVKPSLIISFTQSGETLWAVVHSLTATVYANGFPILKILITDHEIAKFSAVPRPKGQSERFTLPG